MATQQVEKVVGVWYGETPELEYWAWVVADEETDGMVTVHTQTVKAFGDDFEAAVEFGRLRAEKRGVRLVVQE